jgi:UDP-glucose 4-epimerase
VREVIKLVSEAAGRSDVVANEEGRRAGDPAFLCADVSLIFCAISFRATRGLAESTVSAFV